MSEKGQIEQELIEKAVAGDRRAFGAVVRGHYDMIYRVAFKWCGNEMDAEDIAQDVCVKLGQAIRGFKGDSAFSSWLYRITLNAVRDFQRAKASNLKKIGAMALVSEDSYEADQESELTATQLWGQVKELPEKQRDAVLLVHAEGLSHKEAAEIIGCSESTVSWHIHEAKKTLKSLLEET